MTAPKLFSFTYADLQKLTGLTKAGVSQHLKRGNLDPTSLLSVAAFVLRYGRPDVRLDLMERFLNIDRQKIERGRPQSTIGVPRQDGKLLLSDGTVRKPRRAPRAS